jgi:glycosyltransferase involved in cell wall biosynthesis
VRVLITSEQRYQRTPDGAVWTPDVNAYGFWRRYLDVFEHVDVLARVQDVGSAPATWIRADGPSVAIKAVPYFRGSLEYLRYYGSLARSFEGAFSRDAAVIMRVPSALSHPFSTMLASRRYPFALEVVGDPYDVFSPGAVTHPLRPILRKWFSTKLKSQCSKACAVAYVTREALQRRYPCHEVMVGISDVNLPRHAYSATYSSIELKPDQIAPSSRTKTPIAGTGTLAFVGSLAQMYKAPDVLLRATKILLANGCDVALKLVGDGQYRPALESLADRLGIKGSCEFLGQVPSGTGVQTVLDSASIFVLPSRVEGLPRAMIEAMARGLPCIGSRVGGIPELLPTEDLVEAGNPESLAALLEAVIRNPERQIRMSKRNLIEAQAYSDDVLGKKRVAFYRHVEHCVVTHLRTAGQCL